MIPPRTALWLDAVGCALGGVVLLASNTVWRWTDLPESWQVPVGLLLLLFAIILIAAALTQASALYKAAVAGNMLWIVGGVVALFYAGTILGWSIILIVIVADGAMAYLQSRSLLLTTT